MLNKIILTVEHTFPAGTKRRRLLNAMVKPVAKVFGVPVIYVQPDMRASECDGFVTLINKAEEIEKAGNTYWESIANVLRIKTEIFFANPEGRLVFPQYEKPLVSILIITFNKVEYTFQCLETIKAYSDIPYELIIVDNNSSDSTKYLLERIEHITIIRNRENIGFLKACNQGAAHAKGEFILFLNNDTQVGPNWLEQLVSTARKYPNCGAVGAKLVFPNGKLQEAGSIVWKDGSCTGYGRGDDPFNAEYSYPREVHYCSGALLLTPRELFLRLGKFDNLYEPAYYEEADYCMTLRKNGYRVMYQPVANIIHYEFGSGKRDWAIALQKRNRERFVEKWKDVLASYHEAAPDNVIKARALDRGRKRMLFIDDRIPDPALGSGYPRSNKMLSALVDLDYDITFFPLLNPEKPEPVTSGFQQKNVEVFYSYKPTMLDFEAFFRKRIGYYDIALVSRPHNMKEVGKILKKDPGLNIIYDAEAIFALREIGFLELEGKNVREEKKEDIIKKEVELTQMADGVIAVSKNEKNIFEKYGARNVSVVGHLIEAKPSKTDFEERRDILFVGSILPFSPNEDSVIYFVREIFPLIKKKIDCKLYIAGTNKSDVVWKLNSEDIKILGRVDDLTHYYDSCRVFVAPTRYAAGIPHKVEEASAHGIPSVVTSLIGGQLGWNDGEQVLIGSDADNFAEKIISLYSDKKLWEKISHNTVEVIKKNCSHKAFMGNFSKALKSVDKVNVG